MRYAIRVLSIGLLSFVVLALVVVSAGNEAARAAGAVLYGVTGDGGTASESLFRIDHETASTRLVSRLGNGGDGEEIAYNPRNDRLLHASGRVIGEDQILEWINPSSLSVTSIPVSGDQCDEVSALTYIGGGTFLAGTIDLILCSITDEGVITKVATLETEDVATGLAWVDGKLYATVWGTKTNLVTIDPKTGEITSETTIEVDADDYRFTALTAHPCTGELYAVMAVGSTEIRTPTTRSLVTIDPESGRVTIIDDLGDSFAGLAFVSDSCEPEQARPNVGGAIGAIVLEAAQANRESDAVAVAPATSPPSSAAAPPLTVAPPSTGDGGLLFD